MLLQGFQPHTLLCLGDVMLDRFTYGKVQRISPEAPIPVLHMQDTLTVLGGAGNVARNITALGLQVHFILVTGDDFVGREVQASLQEYPFIYPQVIQEIGRQTPLKIRFVAEGQQLLRADQESAHDISAETEAVILQKCYDLLPTCQGVILSDYAKGTLTPHVCQTIIQQAKALNIPVLVDPKGQDYTKYQGATLITPNQKELSAFYGYPLPSEEAIHQAASRMRQHCQTEAILVTRGSQGMTLVDDQQAFHIPTQARDVFDVSGAGDTVIATLACALTHHLSFLEAAHLANKAAGIVVGKSGTAFIESAELFDQRPSKIASLSSLTHRVQDWQRKGLCVGFTNGCFDLLHSGHLQLLTEAKRQCDRLVVGLNADRSVKLLKGPSRPIQNEQDRAYMLAALEIVDAVVLFEEETPLTVIETLQPDVLVKGADYTIEQVVGAECVQKKGGRVVLVDLKEGYSTTRTVEKMLSVA